MLKLSLLLCFTLNVLVASFPSDESVIEGRLIGGNDTDITQFPYQVALYVFGKFLCGGFIVSPKYIVTSGLSTYRLPLSEITVRAGSSNFKHGGVMVGTSKAVYHPNFNYHAHDYDVVVIQLDTPLKIDNKTMKPIKLATKEPAGGSEVLISGWGYVSVDYDESEILRSAKLSIYDRAKCESKLKSHNVTFTSRMICAYSDKSRVFTGDSGSPIVYKDEAVGFTSFSIGEYPPTTPGVFTNIANPEITKFIKETAKL